MNNEEKIDFLNKKTDEIGKAQENTLLVDFDQALEEEKEETLTIKILGEYYILPGKMPFNFSTFFLRNCYKKIKGKQQFVMEENQIVPFLELMFGKKFVKKLEETDDNRISTNFIFEKIVPKIMSAWGQDIDTSNAQKKIVKT